MRRFIWITVGLLAVTALQAQKKELSQARAYIKSGKDFDKAEKLMTDLLKSDAASRSNKRVWLTWLDAVSAQYDAANEKLYLKQKYDTTAFFDLTRRMFRIAEGLDSLDMLPDKKGRVRPEYRKSDAEKLNLLRPNLYYGGSYHARRNDYRTAYDFFDSYLDTDRQPLFTGYDYLASDTLMVQAAYWATFCGSKLHDAERTLRYAAIAKRDTSKANFTLQYMAEAYHAVGDQTAYMNTLHEGFQLKPEYPYFFPRLVDGYTAQGANDEVMKLAEYGLSINPENTLFLLAKSIALLNMERYEECKEVSRQMIQLCDTLPEPYYNVATCLLNQALETEKLNEPRKYRSQLRQLYLEARPYMEDYRRLAPDDQKRWGPALYRIYLNLNMGRQFEEIDRLIKQ